MLIEPKLVISISLPELKVNAERCAAASSLIDDKDLAAEKLESEDKVGIDALKAVSVRFLSLEILISPTEFSKVVPPELK